ncbi:MAG: ATP-dependent helicase [Anaerolineaceae bacterium]|nr:ATP-dependent helicase [Anaerolineaceae bacterium]
MFKPRPMQEEVLRYTHGKMGVAAVPGSGKTQTLSKLAADLITGGYIQDDQEILIVTLVNSAVDNFSRRVSGFIQQSGLLPDIGYRVRTLHGLAHDIVRERPDLVGLSDRFQIVDEREANEILQNAVQAWLRSHPELIEQYTSPEIDLSRNHNALKKWPELVTDIAGAFIRQAKDLQVTPAEIKERIDGLGISDPLLGLGYDIYVDYQRALNYRSAVDFDDLIRLALQALQLDPDFLKRLHFRWPYILEDEAQDSSRLQEEIIRTLVGQDGNWVRVGDTNQAIFETFTTASPRFLRNFLHEPGVTACDLPDSGRSTYSIINLANRLIEWVQNEHPYEALREALTPPFIRPSGPDDPQPNPPDNPAGVFISDTNYAPDKEIQDVVRSIKRWLPEHPEETVAVLAPRNERGAQLVDELKRNSIPYVELLRSSLSTRQTARILAYILRYLSDPASANKLTLAYQGIREYEVAEDDKKRVQDAAAVLRKCVHLEDYLWPRPNRDWLASFDPEQLPEDIRLELEDFRTLIHRWQSATLLPVDQLLLTIAQELFANPADLALAHKLALVLERDAQTHPEWQLPEFSEELDSVARNERKFIGFSDEDSGFDPNKHQGKVAVATIHKAKGLEWDRVYLLSINNYDFPSAESSDSFISERWFVRDHLNLQAEALARLNALLAGDVAGLYVEEGIATQQSRLDYAEERLRLLYVGITRAKKELTITWNTGQRGTSQPALALRALQMYLKGQAS